MVWRAHYVRTRSAANHPARVTRQMTDAIGLREPLMEGPLFRAWVDRLFAGSILFTAGGGLQSRLA